MRKIENTYYSIKYGCLYLYYEDLVDIIGIINRKFKEYTLEVDDYEITHEDNIKTALEQIKKEGVEVAHDLKLGAEYLLNNNDYITLDMRINSYNSEIYTHNSDNDIIRGIMAKLDEILSLRVKKLRNFIELNYFIEFLGALFLFLSLKFGIDFIEKPDNLLLGVALLLVFLGIIFLILTFPGTFNKSKIYLLKYNEKKSWYSIENIKKHAGTIIVSIFSIVIGGIITAIILSFINM